MTDPIEAQLRTYYEAEAARRGRPQHGDRRRELALATATEWVRRRVESVLDVGSGPAGDHAPFTELGIGYIGVDLAQGNSVIAAESGIDVVPATLFHLPFPDGSFDAGWSMSTFQHVPDDRIDEALTEFVRVLAPGAPVMIGIWGGRDEVLESDWSASGVTLPRHFTLRTHQRITSIFDEHLAVQREELWPPAADGWEYHVLSCTAR